MTVTPAMKKAGWDAPSANARRTPHVRIGKAYEAMRAVELPTPKTDTKPDADALVERVAFEMARVIAYRHGASHKPDDWLNDQRRGEARAAIATIDTEATRGRDIAVEAISEALKELGMDRPINPAETLRQALSAIRGEG